VTDLRRQHPTPRRIGNLERSHPDRERSTRERVILGGVHRPTPPPAKRPPAPMFTHRDRIFAQSRM